MKRIVLFALVGLVMGCAGTKKVVSLETVDPQAAPLTTQNIVPVAAIATPPATPEVENYTVKKGDCLWKIAAAKYSDPFQWPLIFQSNRTTINDPDLIYPKQVFSIDHGADAGMVERARDVAKATPKHHKHHKVK